MAAKACVFCGAALAKPDRTKEHILPMWLLRMTGDPNRQFRLGTDLRTAEEWIRPASSITFPACDSCNQKYGKGLEAQAHKIIRAIQDGKSISVANAYRLLDWLDKVRVGLWLGLLTLQKEGDFAPKFSIDSRRGRKDRIAIIAVDPDDNSQRLNFGGTDNNLFRLSQCGLYLRINNIRILSISADFLLTRETGLPHGEGQYLVEGRPGFVGAEIVLGNYKLSQDWSNFTRLGGTVLAQPIIDARAFDAAWALNLYTNSRVMKHVKDSFRANGIDQFLRIIPMQLISNVSGKFAYHWNKRQKIRVAAKSDSDDAAFMRVLYALMVDRALRNFPKEIRLADGRKIAWFVGYQKSLDCMWQLRRRLNELGIEFPDTNILVDEIQRFDRILEEQFAAAEGTLVDERPLIG